MEHGGTTDNIKLNKYPSRVDPLLNLSIIRALDYGVTPD